MLLQDANPTPSFGGFGLKGDLAKAGFELAGLFSHKKTDTQAFLAISRRAGATAGAVGVEDVAILAFRGTASIRDWLSNVKFLQKDAEGAEVHWGFQGAFKAVEPAIRRNLGPLVKGGRTLYLTGHSLGGALALIATREMASDSYGACYTFGSPRVGRFGFALDIKTPIYRVVNANDLIPRLPPAYVPSVLIFALRIMNVPAFGLLKALIGKITKYVHYGDMRFLRRTKSPTYDDLEVLANPSVVYRFFWYWPALFANWKSPIENHGINLYCAKLAAWAKRRNSPTS